MSDDMGSIQYAMKIARSTRAIAKEVVNSLRPAPKYATVMSIDESTKSCMVTYVGESDWVKVPYGSIAPNEVGQDVRIEGVPGDRYITAIIGKSRAEARIIDTSQSLDETKSTVSANDSQTKSSITAIRSSRPLYEGVDPTGESTFDYQLLVPIVNTATFGANANQNNIPHAHGIGTQTPVIAISSSYALWGFIRCILPSDKTEISWLGYKTGTVSEFYYDIYRMDTTTGTVTKVYGSPNIASQLGTAFAWLTSSYTMFPTQSGEVYGVQFSMVGSGNVWLAGIQLPAPLPPGGFRPAQIGAARNPTDSNGRAPATLSGAATDVMYTGLTVYLQLGSAISTTIVPIEIYDPFDTAFDNTWILKGTPSSGLYVEGGVVKFGGNDGYATATKRSIYATNKMSIRVQVSCYSTNAFVGSILGSRELSNTYIELRHRKNGIQLCTMGGYASGSPSQVGSYSFAQETPTYFTTLTYDPATLTYKVYLNDSVDPVITWVDTNNVVPRSRQDRYASISINQGFFDNGGVIGDFTAKDIP